MGNRIVIPVTVSWLCFLFTFFLQLIGYKGKVKAYNEVVSEDYVWIKHSTGEEIPRDELSKWLISPDAPKSENARIIYENDEIGVAHYFVSFKDGSRQAFLVVYIIKDGKIIRSETGATNITKK